MHLLGVILDVLLLLLRAKRTLLARPGTESLVWRNVLQRLHREADTQGREEEEQKKTKRTTQSTQQLP